MHRPDWLRTLWLLGWLDRVTIIQFFCSVVVMWSLNQTGSLPEQRSALNCEEICFLLTTVVKSGFLNDHSLSVSSDHSLLTWLASHQFQQSHWDHFFSFILMYDINFDCNSWPVPVYSTATMFTGVPIEVLTECMCRTDQSRLNCPNLLLTTTNTAPGQLAGEIRQ